MSNYFPVCRNVEFAYPSDPPILAAWRHTKARYSARIWIRPSFLPKLLLWDHGMGSNRYHDGQHCRCAIFLLPSFRSGSYMNLNPLIAIIFTGVSAVTMSVWALKKQKNYQKEFGRSSLEDGKPLSLSFYERFPTWCFHSLLPCFSKIMMTIVTFLWSYYDQFVLERKVLVGWGILTNLGWKQVRPWCGPSGYGYHADRHSQSKKRTSSWWQIQTTLMVGTKAFCKERLTTVIAMSMVT